VTDVVYVHGLWKSGNESLILRRRLAYEFGFRTHVFRYSSVSSMTEITTRLASFVRELQSPDLCWVGHCLGGLVIYRFLERYPLQPPGRVVFLASPSMGSRAATSAGRIKLFARLMGKSITEELLRPKERRWKADRDLGVIAGTRPLGLRQFVARFDERYDGTVGVSETRLPGATDHLVLPVSHHGMLFSARVALETGLFLQQGSFSVGERSPIMGHGLV
jgi:pimeloyl-ACP methyl ester carboxylesterase